MFLLISTHVFLILLIIPINSFDEYDDTFDDNFYDQETKKEANDEDSIEKMNILQNHHMINTEDKNYEGLTLGYVTPWNSRGYDIAKWATKKFNIISPVWFSVKIYRNRNGFVECFVSGVHDIDRGWINEILRKNSTTKIIPRFLFNEFGKDSYREFIYSEITQLRCVQTITNFVIKQRFHGAVLELWIQFMVSSSGQAGNYLTELMETFSTNFHAKNLIVILPIPPPILSNNNEGGIITVDQLKRLGVAVDYINLMTYDYKENGVAPNAPLNWIINNLNFVIKSGVNPSKLMLGLNWYGYHYTYREKNAVLGKDFLNYLQNPDAIFKFEFHTKEHILILGEKDIIYYPTKKSITYRLDLARKFKLAGIAIWDIGQGLDYFTSLL